MVEDENARSRTEWRRTISGVVVGALLAGVVSVVVTIVQVRSNEAENRRERAAAAELQRAASREESAEELRIERRAAYAEYVTSATEVLDDMMSLEGVIVAVDQDRGSGLVAGDLVVEKKAAAIDESLTKFLNASATVELLGGDGAQLCASELSLAISRRRLLAAHAMRSLDLAAAEVQVSGGSEAAFVVDDRFLGGSAGIEVWLKLQTELMNAFVQATKSEVRPGAGDEAGTCSSIGYTPESIGVDG